MKNFYLFVVASLLISILLACSSAQEISKTVHTEVKKEVATQKAPDKNVELFNASPQEMPLPEKIMINATLISQLPELPNGCEVTSLAMLLQTAGVDIDKMTLAKEMKKVPFEENGVFGDPNEGFVGNMYHGAPGFAVYHGPIADLAKRYLSMRIIDLTGGEWMSVERKLAEKHPVWVIINSAYKWLPPEYFQDWPTKNGDMKVTMHEHSVLITGYDATNVYFNDPLTDAKDMKANKEDFIDAWKQMGSQAISYN